MDSLYKVRKKSKLGRICQPESGNGDEMIRSFRKGASRSGDQGGGLGRERER